MKPTETVIVDPNDDNIFCDGGEYYGHPRVYLTLDETGTAECYYCSCRFVARQDQDTDSQATQN